MEAIASWLWGEFTLAMDRLRQQKAMTLAVCDRVLAAHEVLARRAERREWTLTETDYPLE